MGSCSYSYPVTCKACGYAFEQTQLDRDDDCSTHYLPDSCPKCKSQNIGKFDPVISQRKAGDKHKCGRCQTNGLGSNSAWVTNAPASMFDSWCFDCIDAVNKGASSVIYGTSVDKEGFVIERAKSPKNPTWFWPLMVGIFIVLCLEIGLGRMGFFDSADPNKQVEKTKQLEDLAAKEVQKQAEAIQTQAEVAQRQTIEADSRAKQQSEEIQRIENNISQMQEQMKNMPPAQQEQMAAALVEQMKKSARMRSAADQQKGVSIPSPTPTVLMIPKGMFMVGNELYYSNGSAYCRYESWESFVALTGRRDVKGIQVYPTLPANMIGGDTCRGY